MLVLLIEDNRNLAANMIEYLEEDGFECDYAETGLFGQQLALQHRYDVIILDLNLPDINGIELCQNLRQQGQTLPIILLTAQDSLEHKLNGFDAGSDDYLVKPIAMAELSARLEVINKRQSNHHSSVLSIGDLSVDLNRRDVTRAGQNIQLTRACYEILVLLMQTSPNVVTKEQICQRIWHGNSPDSDALKSHIYQLRKQVDRPFEQALICTVRGVGLVLKSTS